MEKDIYLKFGKMRKEVKLSDTEKNFHRGEILKFIESEPSPYADKRTISRFSFTMLQRHMILASLTAMIILGGGVTMSANGSLPSDLLYKIKTNINEPILLFFTPTSEGKTAMKVALVNRRLREFSEVTLNKNLNQKEKMSFVNHLSVQIKDTQKEILKLAVEKNRSGAFHANNNLQSILTTQDLILDKIYTTNPKAADTSEFTSMINNSIEETAQIENQITDSVSVSEDETEIDQTIDNLKQEINSSLKEIEGKKLDLSVNTESLDVIDQESLDTAISDINEDLDLANKEAGEGKKQESLKIYNTIDKKLSKMKSLIEVKKQLRFEKKD